MALALAAGLAACGGGGGEPPAPPLPPPPIIVTTLLSDGLVGIAYTATVQALSGRTPYSWAVSAGTLPAGLSLNATTGEISGTPTAVGTSSFTLKVTDSTNQTDTQDYTMAIGTQTPLVERVSVANDGSQANGDSGTPALSGEGRFVAFTSFATNLVADDTNNFADVFLRDRTCPATVLVSVASDTTQANNQSFGGVLSSVTSGTLFVAYASDATNLVPGDTNQGRDVFVTAVDVSSCPPAVVSTVRASVASDGSEAVAPSTTQLARSQQPSISANGLVVAYHSNAANLAPADSNSVQDIFVTELDFSGGTLSVVRTRRVNLFQGRLGIRVGRTQATVFTDTTIGSDTLTMTDDEHIGREAEILEGAGAGQVRTIIDNDATTLTVAPAFSPVPQASSFFRIVSRELVTATVFTNTTLGSAALALRDDEHIGRVLEIVSGTGVGQLRRITDNDATTFTVDPAWDPVPDGTSVFRLLRQAASDSFRPQISPNGAFALFDTGSSFEEEDTNNAFDVFLHDLATSSTSRINLNSLGVVANGNSVASALSGDASEVLFLSFGTNLSIVVLPTLADIFSSTTIGNSTLTLSPDAHKDQTVQIIAGIGSGQARKITTNTDTTLTVDTAWSPVPDATSLFQVVDDTNSFADLFVRDLGTGETIRVNLANDGSQSNGATDTNAFLSANGVAVAFLTTASNLVDGDRNATSDVYLRNRTAATTSRISRAMGDTNPNAECIDPGLSLDGSTVVFSSTATNLVTGDTNNVRDVFLVTTGISDPPVFLTAPLYRARLGVAFSTALPAVGGTQPLFWTLAGGSLPPGVFLDSRRGILTGLPQRAGRYQFTILVLDSGRPPHQSRKIMTLVVEP